VTGVSDNHMDNENGGEDGGDAAVYCNRRSVRLVRVGHLGHDPIKDVTDDLVLAVSDIPNNRFRNFSIKTLFVVSQHEVRFFHQFIWDG
jgi:hypothetical protein